MSLPKPYYESEDGNIFHGNALDVLKGLPSESVNCCVTSPPYWGLRDYQVEGQLGLERTPEEYVAKMVEVFSEVNRVLRGDGVLFLNLGDSYNGSGGWGGDETPSALAGSKQTTNNGSKKKIQSKVQGLKPKDLVGIPWMVAFALRSDGWYLRSEIIWHKPNPMPESVNDRPTKSHETIFLMSKKAKYFYDAAAIAEPLDCKPHAPGNNKLDSSRNDHDSMDKVWGASGKRNRRSVWTVSTAPFPGAHFATFPPKLIEPCILAGCPSKVCAECGAPWERILSERKGGIEGDWHSKRKTDGFVNTKPSGQKAWDSYVGPQTIGFAPTCSCNSGTTGGTVLDPFMGAGTSAIVSYKHGRKFMGIELSQKYLDEITIPRIEAERKQLKLF